MAAIGAIPPTSLLSPRLPPVSRHFRAFPSGPHCCELGARATIHTDMFQGPPSFTGLDHIRQTPLGGLPDLGHGVRLLGP
eukprot:608104-Alexandrium_andersonii.AAC.1